MKSSHVLYSILAFALVAVMLLAPLNASAAPASNGIIGINVLLKTNITNTVVTDLGRYGTVLDQIPEIRALTMRIDASQLPAIQALSYVASASPDDVRSGIPVATLPLTNFSAGYSTWDLDLINVTNPGTPSRVVSQDGTGVYVAVLDTGLLPTWPAYFPTARIATNYARCFGGGGGENGFVSNQPNKWGTDTDSHGTHVTSTIIGYAFGNTPINGVAPNATIIPVKVLNQNGSGWSSVIARGIVYVADLKAGVLAGSPVVINMSLGGSRLDAVEAAAIDYAVSQGVIIVAAAGNTGNGGMHYPGAYEPVISVAAAGWTGEWTSAGWWYANVPELKSDDQVYITDFSSREKSGQYLDVAAPGSWVLGPYQPNNGQLSYYYMGGTSMATPHVTGVVALMAQKKPTLTASEAHGILENTAIAIAPGCRTVPGPSGVSTQICWGGDATGYGLVDAQAALAKTR
jgi:subtilisin family serine protease